MLLDMNGAIRRKMPPGRGAMTSFTRVPAGASESSQKPAGSIEPGPALAGGPCHARREGGANSVHSKLPSAPRAIL